MIKEEMMENQRVKKIHSESSYKRKMMGWMALASLFTLLVVFISELRIDQYMDQMIFSIFGERTYAVTQLAVSIAHTEVIIVLSILISATLLITGHRTWAFFYFRLMFFGCLLGYVLKEGVSRPRPNELISVNLWRMGTETVSQSFPSGHAMKIVFLAGFLVLFFAFLSEKPFSSRILGIGGLIVLLVGLGQILNGRHYFTDVIGGYSWAFAWVYVNLHYESLKKDRGILRTFRKRGEGRDEANTGVWNHHRQWNPGKAE